MMSLIFTSLEKNLGGGSHAWTGKNTPLPPEAKFSPPAGIFGAAHLCEIIKLKRQQVLSFIELDLLLLKSSDGVLPTGKRFNGSLFSKDHLKNVSRCVAC